MINYKYIQYNNIKKVSFHVGKKFSINKTLCVLITTLMVLIYINKIDKYYIKIFSIPIEISSNIPLPKDITDYINNTPIIKINLWEIRKKLLNLKSCADIHVKLILPNKLYIFGFLRQEYALWKNNNSYHLIDKSGFIIKNNVNYEEFNKYPIFIADNIDKLPEILQSIEKYSNQNGKILSLTFINKRRWDILLDNGIIIKLPENNLKYAFRLLENMLLKKDFQNMLINKKIIDLRLLPKKIILTS